MGLFGGQTRVEPRVEPSTIVDKEEEQREELPSLPKPRPNTVITKGVTVSGAIRGEGVVQVEGNVEGEIAVSGSVIVTSTGTIQGPVSADVVRISGHVVGDIMARSHLRLEKTGNVEGDVTTPSMVLEDGSRLNGRSTMIREEAAPAPAQPEGPALDNLQFGPNYKVGEEAEEEES